MVPIAEKLEWILTTGTPQALALSVPDDRIEQIVQQRMQEQFEESKNRIIKTATRIMESLFGEVVVRFNKIIKEIDSVYMYSSPMEFAFCIYCTTKKIDGDLTLKIRKIERELHEKYPNVNINVDEALVGDESLIPSYYYKAYPAK
ncbi:MAG: hypothetical protein WCT39_02510 [Candidatus Margulisiibacteriota bacterium]